MLLSQHSFLIASHRIASLRFFLLLLVAPPQSLARLPLRLLCLLVCFFCFFVFLWPAPSVSGPLPPPAGRAVFLYLSSNSLLSSLSLPSHIWLAPWWFGFGFVRCSTRVGSDMCWRGGGGSQNPSLCSVFCLRKSVAIFGFGPWWTFF